MRLWGIVRRTDLLLVALVLLLSAVLYLRLAPPSEEAKEIQAPERETLRRMRLYLSVLPCVF